MKVSKEKRAELRRALVDAAVALFGEKGPTEPSMREVASRAGVAPATAYKYFPQREQLYSAYFELKLDDAQTALHALQDFEEFNLQEKLHAYLESLLAEYVSDREFVQAALRGLMNSPLQSLGALNAAKRKATVLVAGFFDEAVEDGEIPRGPFHDFLVNAFWDYSTLVVLYWLKDDSEGFTRTSELIDLTLQLYVAVVRSGLVDRAAEVLSFLVRSHLYGNLDQVAALVSRLRDHGADGSGGTP